MNIKKIGILGGTNSLGKCFAKHWQKQFPEISVLVSGRQTELTNQDLVTQCDVVVFAVPIRVTKSVMTELAPLSRPEQIWLDITSTKQEPVKWMLASRAEVCGTHPTFGPMSDITGNTVVLCPARISDENFSLVKKLFSDFKTIETTPDNHDRMMGIVQNVSHFSDMVLGETLRRLNVDMKEVLQYTSPSYILKMDVMGRLFNQNADLYTQIATQNPYGTPFTKVFQEVATDWQKSIAAQDTETLNNEFREVRKALGEDFCAKAYQKSQEIFYFEYDVRNRDNPNHSPLPKNHLKEAKSELIIFGDPDSHTDSAAKAMCKQAQLDYEDRQYANNFSSVFEFLENQKAGYGIVPYENSTEGSVFQVLDLCFAHTDINIIDALESPIEQYLMGIPETKLENVATIVSHPQALAQSRASLTALCPSAHLIAEKSTAYSAEKVARDGRSDLAAIGPKGLSKTHKLQLLTNNLATADNRTRFVLLAKKPIPKDKPNLSLGCWFDKDGAGNLAEVLNFFATHKINLTKLDSRRAEQSQFGGYVFFFDAEISLSEFNKLETKFKLITGGFKILGSY